jgi:DNA polymerase III epsilon subunit-like protein
MLICLDTEFTGLNPAKPDLISIALVDATGREFYAELPEENWTVECNE